MDKRILTGEKIIVSVGNIKFGGDNPSVMIAGPCSVESRDQIIEIALKLKQIGVSVLRGGVFKPRTSPYTFQGLGIEGLKFLREAGDIAGLPIVTELMDEEHLDIIENMLI